MTPFAWHRILLPIQDKWSPIEISGTAVAGSAKFADLHRPRLGLRWQRIRKPPKNPEKVLRDALRHEVGLAESNRALPPDTLPLNSTHALVHEDIEPYKRDIAVVYFPEARCVVQLTYLLRRRENVLQTEILPGLTVLPDSSPSPWSVFGLSCLTPPSLTLERHRLNAGDLSLSFATPRRYRNLLPALTWASVREIAAPELALQRSKLFGWLRTMQTPDARFFKPAKESTPTELTIAGRTYPALRLNMPRKRRFFFLGKALPNSYLTLGAHDTTRDRLVLLHGTHEPLLREIAATLGAATKPQNPTPNTHQT